MIWPTLTDEKRKELNEAANESIVQLTRMADSLTRYPGGGGAAHHARQAADHCAKIRVWLNETEET